MEQALLQRQMSQGRRKAAADSDVPFGIRAIQSGIEVEGVWISHSHTPTEKRTRDTSVTSSSKWNDGPRKDFDVEVESRGFFAATGGEPSSSRYRASGESSSPDFHSDRATSSNTHHPPLADFKSSEKKKGEAIASSEISNKSGGTDSDSTLQHTLLQNNQKTKKQKQSTDLDLRRISQAAETGQLTPRVKKRDEQGEQARNLHHEIGDYDFHYAPPPLNRRGQSSPTDRSPPTTPWPSSPQLENPLLPPSVFRSSLPDVTPFTEFCMSGPTVLQKNRRTSDVSDTRLGNDDDDDDHDDGTRFA